MIRNIHSKKVRAHTMTKKLTRKEMAEMLNIELKKSHTVAQLEAMLAEKQKAEKQTISRAQMTENKRAQLEELITSIGMTFRATENDLTKKKRLFVVAENKPVCCVHYSTKGTDYRVKASVAYKDSEYHKGWAQPYSSVVALDKLKDVFADILVIKAEKKATKKKAEKKAEK